MELNKSGLNSALIKIISKGFIPYSEYGLGIELLIAKIELFVGAYFNRK